PRRRLQGHPLREAACAARLSPWAQGRPEADGPARCGAAVVGADAAAVVSGPATRAGRPDRRPGTTPVKRLLLLPPLSWSATGGGQLPGTRPGLATVTGGVHPPLPNTGDQGV